MQRIKIMRRDFLYVNIVVFYFVFILLNGCSRNENNDNKLIETNNDKRHIMNNNVDHEIKLLSDSVLVCLKKKDLNKLAGYIHPNLGVRFSPYAFIDTVNHLVMSRDMLSGTNIQKEKFIWGAEDGTGQPIKLSIGKYFDKFVYDSDFINAGEVNINKVITRGTTKNNVIEAYPECSFIDLFNPDISDKDG